ncbi:hypothetical protein [Virgibacillus halodenitrificans]|uniref:hypothetical protein n=1 Tax=Virgibacillus halodenitrificans TaxID=1482 RepID=UPI000EF4B35A|nr:hypothetical protein [Virgibacillus halodenitrificans]
MSDRERLEGLKVYLENTFTNDNYEITLCETIGVPRKEYEWLIQQAEEKQNLEARVKELESAALFTHNMQADRIKELEKAQQNTSKLNLLNRIDNIRSKVSSLEEQNKRYKQCLEEVLEEAYVEAGLNPFDDTQLEPWIATRIKKELKGESE